MPGNLLLRRLSSILGISDNFHFIGRPHSIPIESSTNTYNTNYCTVRLVRRPRSLPLMHCGQNDIRKAEKYFC